MQRFEGGKKETNIDNVIDNGPNYIAIHGIAHYIEIMVYQSNIALTGISIIGHLENLYAIAKSIQYI